MQNFVVKKWDELNLGSVLQMKMPALVCSLYSKDERITKGIAIYQNDIVIFLGFDENQDIELMFENRIIKRARFDNVYTIFDIIT